MFLAAVTSATRGRRAAALLAAALLAAAVLAGCGDDAPRGYPQGHVVEVVGGDGSTVVLRFTLPLATARVLNGDEVGYQGTLVAQGQASRSTSDGPTVAWGTLRSGQDRFRGTTAQVIDENFAFMDKPLQPGTLKGATAVRFRCTNVLAAQMLLVRTPDDVAWVSWTGAEALAGQFDALVRSVEVPAPATGTQWLDAGSVAKADSHVTCANDPL